MLKFCFADCGRKTNKAPLPLGWEGESGGLTAENKPKAADKPSWSSLGASPAVASVMAGIAAVMWTEAIIRYVAANNSLLYWNLILPEKTSDVVAIWLAAIVVGVVVFAACSVLFRKRRRVGSVKLWTAILLVSAILRYL